jgi:glycosyltransferase involved in cell wall biosynthesis
MMETPGHQGRAGTAEQGTRYDAAYYRDRCGLVPYGRNEEWLAFFSHIADSLIQALRPQRAYDAGCAWGLLVEAFRDRGVEAWGVDISPFAIGNVREDMRAYCRVGSLTAPIDGRYDLVTCLEVLDHIPENETELVIRNLCLAADTILFSSAPPDFTEPTRVNVRPVLSWLQAFSSEGFAPDPAFDASFVASHAFLLRRCPGPVPESTLALFSQKLDLQCRLADRLQELRRVSDERDRWAAETGALERRLGDLLAGPGWHLISRYRNWLELNRKRHPKLAEFTESIARRVLSGSNRRRAARSEAPAGPRPFSGERPCTFSYEDWIREQEPDEAGLAAQRALAANWPYRPKISIIVPVYKVPLVIVQEMIDSVVGQTYDNWELCLAHADPDADRTRRHLQTVGARDARIKVKLLSRNEGISGNSNRAFELATGEFVGLLDHDDTLAPFALFEVVKALNEDPSVDFLYSDRDEIEYQGGELRRVNPYFKPQWSPEILLVANYLTHFCVMRTEHVRAAGGWRRETDGAQDWDLFWRVIERGNRVRHIPVILYHWRKLATSVAVGGLASKPYAMEAQLLALRDHYGRLGWDADVARCEDLRLRVLWKPQPGRKVSVILVPSATEASLLSHAQHLLGGTRRPPVEIVLPATTSILSTDPRVRVVRVAGGASLIERLRAAVESASGDVMVFVDQAARPIEADWLDEMVGPLQNEEIGIVGAKLLNAGTGRIRHAGLVFTEGNRLEYVFEGEPEHVWGIFGCESWYRDWSAVSGACFSLRRDVWNAAGGFALAPRYPRHDVDLCLKVRQQLGLRVVYNPFARFHQSRPAGLEGWLRNISQPAAEQYLRTCFPEGDPYFHNKLICRDGKVLLRGCTGSAGTEALR